MLLFARSAARTVLVLAGLLAVVSPSHAQNALGDEGLFITVPSPITSDVVARIKSRIEPARNNPNRPIKKVVFDFTPGDKDADSADFGTCYSLGEYISKMHDLSTIGFVSANVSGHAVLPVLGCKELVFSKSASLGEIAKPGDLPNATVKSGYATVLGDSREASRAIVAKMLDRTVSLGKGKKNGATWYVDLRDKAAYEKAGVQASDPTPLPFGQPGMPGRFTTEQARQLGLVAAQAETRQEVAEKYGLSPSSLKDDPLNGRSPLAFRYTLRGRVDNGVREATRRILKDIIRQNGNVLFLVIDCAGGDPSAARDIADDLEKAQQGESPILVVGFIPESAPDTGAIIAFGCHELVMSTGKGDPNAAAREATLGDFETITSVGDAGTTEFLRKNLKELAASRGIPAVLVDGMLDRDLVIVRAHSAVNRSRKQLMTEAEFEADKANWVNDGVIKPRGETLKLTATRAAELDVARFVVPGRDVADVYAQYGIDPAKVKEVTPGWLDQFATYLRIPAVTVILVVIGFAGLILEMKVPGTTVPGIVAALCFILIFWAHTSVNGNAAILGVMLFVLGLVLILLEVFVIPGFGFPGVLGILFMVAGIGIATVDRVPASPNEWVGLGAKIGQYLIALIVAIVLAFTIARYLPSIPGANRMLLESPEDAPAEGFLPGAAQAAALIGAIGAAVTTLRPAGMAQFGEQYVDVVTDGGYIPAGAKVQVIEVEGTRVVVKEV